ncbi:amino acid ABC transporter substrate-binding protein [Novispirillum sp. DQ9]|uniref:amino acid ABC transporter substrate-binding protein n=1 Tax=Novispirillum sp. DQ9 TaxID=3398612 RepID=UPI003C7BCCAE
MRAGFAVMAAGMVAGVLAAAAPAAQAGVTLDEVKARGSVRCGVNELGKALGTLSPEGQWVGFYPEFCRAVAAAVVGDKDAVDYIMISTADRFDAVRSGAVDILSEASTMTLSRDASGLDFPAIIFHDGQGFLTYGRDGVTSMDQLKGQRICVQGVSTSEDNLRDLNASAKMGWEIMSFTTIEGAYSAFFGRQCMAMSTDALILGSMRLSLAPNPADYVLLDQRISHEPIGPVTRDDDPEWTAVVRWTFNAMFQGEELGVTSANADTMRASGPLEARRLLGAEGDLGATLGLDSAWAYRVIKQVGNYAEVYDRTIGPGSEFNLPRGRNALTKDGGLLWAAPHR